MKLTTNEKPDEILKHARLLIESDTLKEISNKHICFSGDHEITLERLPGVFCQGVQYYDLKGIDYINNTGLAGVIDILKLWLKEGVEVEFVNANERIQQKIRSMKLEHIIHCE